MAQLTAQVPCYYENIAQEYYVKILEWPQPLVESMCPYVLDWR